MSLEHYQAVFRELRVTRAGQHYAPHKPCMLLALLELAESGRLTENRVPFSPTLLEPYVEILALVGVNSDRAEPYAAFFDLSTNGFWHLKPRLRHELVARAMRAAHSMADIEQSFEYAYLDQALHTLLQNAEARTALRETLIAQWFSDQQAALAELHSAWSIEAHYERRLREAVEGKLENDVTVPTLSPIARQRVFRRIVLDAYDYRCAASGWRIVLPDNTVIVEAAHLVPTSEPLENDPRYGMALAPSYLWALEKGLIAPGPDLKWHVSPLLDPRMRDNHALLDLKGREILFPRNKRYWPKRQLLERQLTRLRRA